MSAGERWREREKERGMWQARRIWVSLACNDRWSSELICCWIYSCVTIWQRMSKWGCVENVLKFPLHIHVRGLCAPCPTSDTGRSFYTGSQTWLDFDWFQFDQLIHTPRSVRFPWNSPERALRLNSNFDVWPHVQFQSTRKAGRAPDNVLSLAYLVAKVRHDTRILKHKFVCEDAGGSPASRPLRGNNPRCSRLATWQSQTKSNEKNLLEIDENSQRNWTCGASRWSSWRWVADRWAWVGHACPMW